MFRIVSATLLTQQQHSLINKLTQQYQLKKQHISERYNKIETNLQVKLQRLQRPIVSVDNTDVNQIENVCIMYCVVSYKNRKHSTI